MKYTVEIKDSEIIETLELDGYATFERHTDYGAGYYEVCTVEDAFSKQAEDADTDFGITGSIALDNFYETIEALFEVPFYTNDLADLQKQLDRHKK